MSKRNAPKIQSAPPAPTTPTTALDAPLKRTRADGTTRRVTVKDVAERAQVQHASVCVVLNGAKSNTHVSPISRQRILQAAEELGYKRNGAVQAMQSGRFDCVALLLSTNEHRSNLPRRLWDGIHDALAAHNISLLMARLPDEKLTDEGVVPKILREWMADGLLVDYTNHIPQQMLKLIRDNQVPAIWINSQQEGDCIYPDDLEAGERLTTHLLTLGHQKAIYLDFTRDQDDANAHYSHGERINGYRAAMEKAGLEPRVEPASAVASEKRPAFLRALLQTEKRPTAVITYGHVENDLIAATAPELGLSVPRDLSLASFLAPEARYAGLAITTCSVPDHEMGREAVQLLRLKIENPSLLLAPRVLKFDLTNGHTSAPLP